MSEQLVRPLRQVGVADHLWETFNLMAREMGTDRESLVNQALFAFARSNGYLQPGQAARPEAAPAPAASLSSPFLAPAPAASAPPAPAYVAPPSLPSMPPYAPPPSMPVYAPPPPAPAPPPVAAPIAAFAAPQRFEETTPPTGTPSLAPPAPMAAAPVAYAPEEEAPNPLATMAIRAPRTSAAAPPPPTPLPPLVSSPPPMPAYVAPPPPMPMAPPAPPPMPAFAPPPTAPDLGTKMSPDEVRAAQERVLQKAAELERLVRGGSPVPDDNVDDGLMGGPPPAEEEPAPAKKDGILVLYAEGREVDRVTGPRFLIGRGKHCDLIINSGKVSREHAAIVRDGPEYFIEDLGSSNGTWFDKKRITRRKVEDGDEYFVCSEKITCRFS